MTKRKPGGRRREGPPCAAETLLRGFESRSDESENVLVPAVFICYSKNMAERLSERPEDGTRGLPRSPLEPHSP